MSDAEQTSDSEPQDEIREVLEATARDRRRQAAMLFGGGAVGVIIFVAMWFHTDALTDIGAGLEADVTVGLTWGALVTGIALGFFGISLLIHTLLALRS